MILNKKLYDVAKFIITIVLPAIGTLYFALAQIWGLPAAEKVLGTLVAVQTFLGVLLGISSSQYKNSDARFDGDLNLYHTPEEGVKALQVAVNNDPKQIAAQREVTLKVVNNEVPQATPSQ